MKNYILGKYGGFSYLRINITLDFSFKKNTLKEEITCKATSIGLRYFIGKNVSKN